MILKEVINKYIFFYFTIILSFTLFLCCSCSSKANYDNLTQEMPIVEENELSNILGNWHVNEYLGKSVEYHGIGEKTEEQKKDEEIFSTQIKEKYIDQTIKINGEKVENFYPVSDSNYHCSDWSDLFHVYRQPHDIWDGVSPPFFCISIRHTDFDDNLDFIVDNNGNVTLYVNGLFFRLEKAN